MEDTNPDSEDVEDTQPDMEDTDPDTEDVEDTQLDAQLLQLDVEPGDDDQQPGRIQHSAAISVVCIICSRV